MRSLTVTPSEQTLDIIGRDTITFAEWLQQMREAQGISRARVIRIPFPMAMTLARLGRHINPLLHPDNVRMLQTGYRADIQPLAQFLGRMPLSVEPNLFFTDSLPTGVPK
ncbi:MAG: hypothetical protein PF483_15620 [Halothiobacillus sp.]|jgi:hypothetical protein|nr:hypothetical protein [Halothiobacillus sp.]